jgi:hypothetical protein
MRAAVRVIRCCSRLSPRNRAPCQPLPGIELGSAIVWDRQAARQRVKSDVEAGHRGTGRTVDARPLFLVEGVHGEHVPVRAVALQRRRTAIGVLAPRSFLSRTGPAEPRLRGVLPRRGSGIGPPCCSLQLAGYGRRYRGVTRNGAALGMPNWHDRDRADRIRARRVTQ